MKHAGGNRFDVLHPVARSGHNQFTGYFATGNPSEPNYLAVGGADGVVSQLRALLAELDLLMAVDGFPSIADLRAAGAQRI